MDPIVHGIDHVYVPLRNAEAAHRVLTRTLGLPVAWPYKDYGSFASGGVNFGNLHFEVLCASDTILRLTAYSPARVRGIAFHPVQTSHLLAELDRRHIIHSDPDTTPPGQSPGSGAMWTTVRLDQLSTSSTEVFTCEYHNPGIYDYESRQASLDACGGGALGLTRVMELVVASPQPFEAIERWQRLLDPIASASSGCWEFEHGPMLRIVEGPADTVEQLVVAVGSVAAIERASADLAHTLDGLAIRFVE